MAKEQKGKWITLKGGRHVFIPDGMSLTDAIKKNNASRGLMDKPKTKQRLINTLAKDTVKYEKNGLHSMADKSKEELEKLHKIGKVVKGHNNITDKTYNINNKLKKLEANKIPYKENEYGDRYYTEENLNKAAKNFINELNNKYSKDYDAKFNYRIEDGGVKFYDENENFGYNNKIYDKIQEDIEKHFGKNAYREPYDNVVNSIGGVFAKNESKEKITEGNPLEKLAIDRIQEKQDTLDNDRFILKMMKEKGMKDFGGMPIEDIEARIKKNEDYIRVAEGGRKENWKELVEKNNAEMEQRLNKWQERRIELENISRTSPNYIERMKAQSEINLMQDEYYEIFREAERKNARDKYEDPSATYEYVPAYATYKDKFKRYAGEDGSGNAEWSGGIYTNDEFMEHLEDSNWHGERKQLLDAKLTNAQMWYIKNKVTFSAWSVGPELTGKDKVDKLIKEAKELYPRKK